MEWFAVALLFTAGCRSADDRGTTDARATGETGGAGTGDTGPITTAPPPTSLTATCEPTDNALRFACHVEVHPPQPVQIAFTTGSGAPRVHTDDALAADHDVPLYFLLPATTYSWTASATGWPDGLTATGTVTTGHPPAEMDSHLDTVGVSAVPYLGTNAPCTSRAYAVIYDTVSGGLVWYQLLDEIGSLGLLNMVQFTEDHTVLGQTGTQVVEVDLAGDDVVRWHEGVDYDVNLHHDLFERAGRYYLLYQIPGPTTLDGFLIRDRAGNELGRWFSGDHLTIPPGSFGDWMHTNTIWVDDARRVYLSSLTQNTVYRVDGDPAHATFGDPDWFLAGAPPAGLGDDFTLDWSAVDGDDEFSGQHDAHLREDGRLELLDNAHGRVLALSLDEAAHTGRVEQAWDTTPSICGPQGTAMDAAGDTFAGCAGADLAEYGPSGQQVWTGHVVCAPSFAPGVSAARFYPLEGW